MEDGKAFVEGILSAELEHHGVKGMKWGVRRQKRKEAKVARKKEWTKTGGATFKKGAVTNLKRTGISASTAILSRAAKIGISRIQSNNPKVVMGKTVATGILNWTEAAGKAGTVIFGAGAAYQGVQAGRYNSKSRRANS